MFVFVFAGAHVGAVHTSARGNTLAMADIDQRWSAGVGFKNGLCLFEKRQRSVFSAVVLLLVVC